MDKHGINVCESPRNHVQDPDQSLGVDEPITGRRKPHGVVDDERHVVNTGLLFVLELASGNARVHAATIDHQADLVRVAPRSAGAQIVASFLRTNKKCRGPAMFCRPLLPDRINKQNFAFKTTCAWVSQSHQVTLHVSPQTSAPPHQQTESQKHTQQNSKVH